VSGGLFGQAPRTRAEQIEQARQAKEAQLKPEEVSPTERRLRDIKDQKVLERITAGYNGFRAKIGNMVTGGGFAIGPEYYREDLLNGNLVARASAQVSTRAYTRFDAEATLPRLANDKLALNFLASRRDYNSLQFYGPGPDSERTGRSNYRLEDFLVEGTGVVKVLPWANVGGSLGGLWVNVGPGEDNRFISADRQWTEAEVPGLQVQSKQFMRTSVFGQIDYRDNPIGPKSGGNYVFQYSWYQDRDRQVFGFRRMDVDLQQYIPFLNKTRRIVLRAKGIFTESDEGQRPPFYLRPTIGGSDDLRGYRFFRFNDNNAVIYNAEYRWEIFSGLDGAAFFDAGKVMTRRASLAFSDLETSAGFGLRFNARNATFVRIDVGFSHEGFQVWFKFNDAFNQQRFGTTIGQPIY
jgi:outer membrane protein assembly factor BamA